MTAEIEELIEKAKRLANQENFKDALEILEKLYKNNPISEEVRNSLLNTLFAYGGYLNDDYTLQYNEAKDVFKRILQIDPKNYRAHYNLGITNFNLENIDEAKQCYEEAIRIKPDYKYCFYNIGLIYEREGNLQEALKFYEKTLEIDPQFPYAYNARNDILADLDGLKKGGDNLSKQQKLEQLKSLLEMSKRIKIEMIQTLLNIDKDKLLGLLIDWGKNYQFEIDGDFLIINRDAVPHLIRSLEETDV
ncbi:MAG: tetratricopeptide repeat protein [Candidatus Lokiarchaeota archaeon]|nr:tetratricopeptide repeat protein [Candidatus Lokiarchaeota archaeon]